MADKKYTKAFINQLEDFIAKLELQFPNEKDLKLLSVGISTLKMTNPSEIIRKYDSTIYKYKEPINERNEEYFLTNDFSNDEDSQNPSAGLRIQHIKNIITDGNVSKETKTVIWTYLNLLNKLHEKILDTRELYV